MLDRAIKVASSSTCRQKHGAVITKGGRVLSVGINSYRNYPTTVLGGGSADAFSTHAEVAAIKAARKSDLKGATLWVARVSSLGARLSAPCQSCMDVIMSSGVKRVVFTTNTSRIVDMRIVQK